MKNVPIALVSAQATTFSELMKGEGWKAIRAILKRANKTVRVMESPEAMGSYCAVILTDKGFQCESGRSGMSAAYAGPGTRVSPPMCSAKRVLETVMYYNEPLDENDKRPDEGEIIADVLRKVETIKIQSELVARTKKKAT